MAEVLQSIENEVADFLRHERPLWPQAPTACTVPSCGDQKYSSFKDFMKHWSKIHHQSDTVFKCKLCRRTYGSTKHKKSHSKSKFHSGQDVQFETITTSNDQFINPGDILPYKLGSPHYRSEMRKTQRNKQSLQRKMDAERWSAKLPDISEEDTKHKLCRDERVVERNGVLYKDSNMWDSPSKRKRVKFDY